MATNETKKAQTLASGVKASLWIGQDATGALRSLVNSLQYPNLIGTLFIVSSCLMQRSNQSSVAANSKAKYSEARHTQCHLVKHTHTHTLPTF